MIDVDLLFRFDVMRDEQKRLIDDALESFESRSIILAHAPTGLGKTDASLSAALTFALRNDLDVFFVTPKISQHTIALDVVKGINKRFGLSIHAMDLVGRKYMCIHPLLTSSLDHDSFYQACERFRKKEICEYHLSAIGLLKEKLNDRESLLSYLSSSVTSHNLIYKEAKDKGFCPYDISIELAKSARLLVIDYFHIFLPKIREAFFAKLKKDISKSILIVDEAHNLPSRVRSQLSSTISENLLRRIDKEAKAVGYEPLGLNTAFVDLAERYIKDESGSMLVDVDFLPNFIDDPNNLSEFLRDIGESWVEMTTKKSASLKLANFIDMWSNEEPSIIRILSRKKQFSLSIKALDPSIVTNVINDFYAAILMSGTFKPLPMYVDLLGIDKSRVILKEYKSPFPDENRAAIIVDGLSTKYSRRTVDEYKRYGKMIDAIYNASPGGVAVFFPSFKVLNGVLPFINTKPKYVQKENAKPDEIRSLINSFKSNPTLLIGVQGGSLSEGVDYSNGEIKVVVIAGIALDDVTLETKSRIEYYDKKFGKGWEYGYIFPAITKAMQSAGRAIRKETDKAVIVFLDERFGWRNYRKLIDIPFIVHTSDPVPYIRRFFSMFETTF